MVIILGLLAGVTFGASDFIGGFASRRSSTFSVVVFSQLSGLIVLLLLLPVLPHAAPTRSDLLFGILAGFGGAAGITLLYRGLAIGRMSLVSPITAVVAAIVPVAVGLLMHERPSVAAFVGIALALVAVVLISTTEMPGEPASNAAPGLVGLVPPSSGAMIVKNWWSQPGLIEAVLSGIGIGVFYVFLARTNVHAGLWPLAFSRSASTSVILALALVSKRALVPQRGDMTATIFAGILDMVANAMYLIATRYGMLSIAAVLTSLYPASTVLLAWIVLHERLSRLQLAGVVCALVAIALIAAGS